jgi:hypothetical protein
MEKEANAPARAPRLLDQVERAKLIYTRVMNKGRRGVASPLDGLESRR